MTIKRVVDVKILCRHSEVNNRQLAAALEAYFSNSGRHNVVRFDISVNEAFYMELLDHF
jgi:hypothetical protein